MSFLFVTVKNDETTRRKRKFDKNGLMLVTKMSFFHGGFEECRVSVVHVMWPHFVILMLLRVN